MNKLVEKSGKNPFKVPENYFEEVNSKIIAATSGIDRKAKEVNLYDRFRPYLLIAASVAGFIIVSYTALKLLKPVKPDMQLSEVIINELPDEYLYEIDIYSLEANAATVMPFDQMPEVDKADIIDYLLLDNIEINDIYEQF